MTNEPSEFFHVDASMPGRSASESNLSIDHVMEKLVIPFKLRRPFVVDGYTFPGPIVSRLKIRKTTSPIEVETAMEGVDLSSFGNAFSSLMKASAKLQKGEDVTSDVLLQADQIIAERGLTSEPISPVFARTNPNKAFVVTSFAPELEQNFDAVSRAAARFNVTAVRVDKEMSSGPVVDRIQGHLLEAGFVIADLTHARPNVYYEIGYFDALLRARNVRSEDHLLLVAQSIERDAHFDLSHRGIEVYDNPFSLMKIVETWFEKRGMSSAKSG